MGFTCYFCGSNQTKFVEKEFFDGKVQVGNYFNECEDCKGQEILYNSSSDIKRGKQ